VLELIPQVGPFLLRGALLTVELTVLSMSLALVVGLFLGFGRLSKNKLIYGLVSTYIEIVRGTPLLVQLFILYYALPDIGIYLSPFLAGFLGLGLNYAAYIAEIYRAGIQAIPKGQTEAALSLGMRNRLAMRRIILPQAIRIILPPICNYYIFMLKDSSLCAVITVMELMRQAQIWVSYTFRTMDIYVMTAFMYLVMAYPLSVLVRKLELRLKISDQAGKA
jgi:polar amino acid transport system substrate-binding protein